MRSRGLARHIMIADENGENAREGGLPVRCGGIAVMVRGATHDENLPARLGGIEVVVPAREARRQHLPDRVGSRRRRRGLHRADHSASVPDQ